VLHPSVSDDRILSMIIYDASERAFA